MTGGKNRLDWSPALANCSRQFQAVHRSRHINIREDDAYVFARFQNCDSFVSIGSLNRDKTSVLNQIDGMEALKGSSSTINTEVDKLAFLGLISLTHDEPRVQFRANCFHSTQPMVPRSDNFDV